MTVDLKAATDFIHSNARLLDRHRFGHLLEGADPAPVLHTLRAYRNPDGGFGHAVEPDMRGPVSQPVGVHTVMEILHEIDTHDDPMIASACDWLASVTRDDGGVPFCLPSATDYPRAPWWQPSDDSSLIQTAANAAALHALGARHAWLDGATEFCWRRIDVARRERGLRRAVRRRVPGRRAGRRPRRGRARRARLGRCPSPSRAATATSTRRSTSPPGPAPAAAACSTPPRSSATSTRSRPRSKATAAGRSASPPGIPVAAHEWRGIATVRALRVLRAHGRL